jgi:hypothetical protein
MTPELEFIDIDELEQDKSLSVKLSTMLNESSDVLNSAKKQVSMEEKLESEREKRENLKNYYKYKNYWWNDNQAQYHRIKCEKYKKYKETNYSEQHKSEYDEAKRNFRKYFDYSKKCKSNKRFRKLCELIHIFIFVIMPVIFEKF